MLSVTESRLGTGGAMQQDALKATNELDLSTNDLKMQEAEAAVATCRHQHAPRPPFRCGTRSAQGDAGIRGTFAERCGDH